MTSAMKAYIEARHDLNECASAYDSAKEKEVIAQHNLGSARDRELEAKRALDAWIDAEKREKLTHSAAAAVPAVWEQAVNGVVGDIVGLAVTENGIVGIVPDQSY